VSNAYYWISVCSLTNVFLLHTLMNTRRDSLQYLIRQGRLGRSFAFTQSSLARHGSSHVFTFLIILAQFPYAIKALPDVLASQWDSEAFKPYKNDFPEDARESPEALQAHVEDLTQRDVKIAYLKNLQGYLWETGYKTGAYATPLFRDVVPKLKEWHASGVDLAVYSSGSVFAQKLLFGHVKPEQANAGEKRGRPTEDGEDDATDEPAAKRQAKDVSNGSVGEGKPTAVSSTDDGEVKTSAEESDGEMASNKFKTEDLQYLIRDWFDTTNAGFKTESTSYEKIASNLNVSIRHQPFGPVRPARSLTCKQVDPEGVLFLSDNVKEVDAAIAAGMRSKLVDRPGNAPLSDADRDRLEVVESLEEVDLRLPTKLSND
jgi:enolase-phosphatase E1